eukprot:2576519-Amphidinium_carterae.1
MIAGSLVHCMDSIKAQFGRGAVPSSDLEGSRLSYRAWPGACQTACHVSKRNCNWEWKDCAFFDVVLPPYSPATGLPAKHAKEAGLIGLTSPETD